MEAIFFLTQLFNWDTSNEISRRQTLAQHRTGEEKKITTGMYNTSQS